MFRDCTAGRLQAVTKRSRLCVTARVRLLLSQPLPASGPLRVKATISAVAAAAVRVHAAVRAVSLSVEATIVKATPSEPSPPLLSAFTPLSERPRQVARCYQG